MKKVLLSILLAGAASATFAQKSEVAEAKKAWGMFQITSRGNQAVDKQLEALNGAIAHTDKAIADPKSKDMVDAWSYRALLTSAAALIDTVNLDKADANIKLAQEAVEKAKALDAKGTEKENIALAETNITNGVRNSGVLFYQKKNFKAAYDKFVQATVITPTDTAMYLNAGIAARNMDDYPKMIEQYKKVIALNSPQSAALYDEIIDVTLAKQSDTTTALALLKDAKAKYPDNIRFITTETDIYLKKGDIEHAEAMLSTLIAKEPTNASFQAALGNVYLQQALKMQNSLNAIDAKKVKEYNAAKEKRDGLVEKSVPYFKKALELDANNVTALENLKTIYSFKNDTKSYNEIKARLEALSKK
ncbi:tetratricopeptide repeat protein [Pedobacter duraquae]|uniref:Tetratricopeptide repeat protein n=1 Tax=Pedobacter duraquae TaxID=425511 RepID=A0A4V3C348_9SPHI|nr:tetratricopeptide repeat protein [Pedobacter duraquae]TDO20619.1 tetratricopeptide repeat protein [Pedobacter duraquae]